MLRTTRTSNTVNQAQTPITPTKTNPPTSWFFGTTTPEASKINTNIEIIKNLITKSVLKDPDSTGGIDIEYVVPESNTTFKISTFNMITREAFKFTDTIEEWCLLLINSKIVNGSDTEFYRMNQVSTLPDLFKKNIRLNPVSYKPIDFKKDIVFLNGKDLATNLKTYLGTVEETYIKKIQSIMWNRYSIVFAIILLLYIAVEFACHMLSINISKNGRFVQQSSLAIYFIITVLRIIYDRYHQI